VRPSRAARLAAVALVLALVASAACGGTDRGAGAAGPACARYQADFAGLAASSTDESGTARLRAVLGDDVPPDLTGPAEVLDDPSSSGDDRRRAVEDIARWLGVECGGPEGDGIRLVPGGVPAGLNLCAALDTPAVTAPAPETSTVTIWGDASRDDPWAGPLVGMFVSAGDDVPVHDGAEEVTVQGVVGYVAPMPLFQAVSSGDWGHIVSWHRPSGGVIEVAVRGAPGDDARRVAELVDARGTAPALPSDALGPRTAPIHEGRGIAPFLSDSTGGWMLSYHAGGLGAAPGAEDVRLLRVSGLRGSAADLQTLRFWALSTRPVDIRGTVGLDYAAFDAEAGPFGIAWHEAAGVIIQVVGLGLDREAVRAVAASLQEADAPRWRNVKAMAAGARCGRLVSAGAASPAASS